MTDSMIFRIHEINPVNFPNIARAQSVLTPTHLVQSISLAMINSLILQNISSAVVCITVVTNKISLKMTFFDSYCT